MASHRSRERSREALHAERVRIGGGGGNGNGGGPRASSGGSRQPRQSWDVGQSRLSRASKTPSKGGANFAGRMSRTPLKHRPRMSSLAKGPECSAADPRDIKSKTFQSGAIVSLINFLSGKDFKQPLSRKILSSPSTKEFCAIFEFIVQFILPGYEIGASGSKPELEIYNMLRSLGYQYTLNKQHLATVGAPHTWPYALAALDWLREQVELNELAEKADAADDSSFSIYADEEDSRKALYRQNEARLYARYLSGEDDPDFGDFVAKLDEMMMNGLSADEKSLDTLRAECERLEEEIAQRTRSGREGPLLEARRGLEAVEKEEAARQAELKATAAKEAETHEEIATQRRLRATALKERAAAEEAAREVQQKLAKQTVRKEDVQRVLSQRQQQQQALAYQERVKLDLMEASGDSERWLAGMIEKCEPLAIGLRRQANELGLLDALPALQIGTAQMNNADSFVPELRSSLAAEEERMKRRLEEERQKIENEQKMRAQGADELRQASLKVREQHEQEQLLTNEVTSFSERLHAREETMMVERVAWDRKLFALRNEAAGLEKERHQLAERVRLASHELRSMKEIHESKAKEKETTCRALTGTMHELLQCSQDFGGFMRSVGKDFMPPELRKV